MADEPLWVRRREDDGMDARVAVDRYHAYGNCVPAALQGSYTVARA